METTKKVAKALKVLPRLRFGRKKPGGGIESLGPQEVKIIKDRKIKANDPQTGSEREELEFILQKDGDYYRWSFPIFNKHGEPTYLIEKLMHIKEGSTIRLELKKDRATNYYDVEVIKEPETEDFEGEDAEENGDAGEAEIE